MGKRQVTVLRQWRTALTLLLTGILVLATMIGSSAATQEVTSCVGLDIQKINGEWLTTKSGTVVSYSGVAHNRYGWWYCEDGKVVFDYNGFAQNDYGTWLIAKGKVNFDYSGAKLGTVGGTQAWWRVESGKVNPTYSGVAQNEYGWWFFEDGKVDFTFTGVAENKYGAWRIEKGKVNFDYEGVCSYKDGYYYLKDGKVQTNFVGAVKWTINKKEGYWRTVSGKLDTTYTGIGDVSPYQFYFKDGIVAFDFTGFAKSNNKWYYINNGLVMTSYTGARSGTIDGTTGWWRIEKGIAKTSFTGIASNEHGTWYFKNGIVDFDYTGLVTYNNSTWLVEEGAVDTDYCGTYTDKSSGKKYTVLNGKVTGTASGSTSSSGSSGSSSSTFVKPASGSKVVTDISRWNGDVDFAEMKSTGVKGVMLRAAYGTYEDKYFSAYANACEREDLDYGVYQFATWHYGTTKAEAMSQAKTEADALISTLKSHNLTGYVALDLELESGATLKMSATELTAVANYYFGLIRDAGYSPMLYCSISWLSDRMVGSSISVPLWIAYYYDSGSNAFPETRYGSAMAKYKSQIKLWQFTSTGQGSAYGCSSQYVDISYLYGDFTP